MFKCNSILKNICAACVKIRKGVRNVLKRISNAVMSILIVMIMMILTLPCFLTSYVEAYGWEESGAVMVKLGLLRGYEDGSLGLERSITRAEFATIAVRMLGCEDMPPGEGEGRKANFKDVPEGHWAYNKIKSAEALGIIRGYEDGTFRPVNNITYAEAVAMIIRTLGYDAEVNGPWPEGYMSKAVELGIDRDLALMPGDVALRGDIAVMVVNSLKVKMKR